MNPLGSYLPKIFAKYRPDSPELVDILQAIVEQMDLINGRIQIYKTGQVEINRIGQTPNLIPNLNVNGFVFANSVAAGYAQTSLLAGLGYFTWDTEIFNSSLDHFAPVSTNEHIEIRQNGIYLVTATVRINGVLGQSDVGIYKNGIIEQFSTLNSVTNVTHNFCIIVEMKQNDYIRIESFAGDRYGDADRFSTLFITRLN